MSKLISELPEVIRLRALECQINESNYLSCDFNWNKTKEGYIIWNEVHKSNYQPFYDFHNIKQSNVKQWCKEKSYNEYFVMIIEEYLKENNK